MIYLHFKQIMQTCFLKKTFLCVQYKLGTYHAIICGINHIIYRPKVGLFPHSVLYPVYLLLRKDVAD